MRGAPPLKPHRAHARAPARDARAHARVTRVHRARDARAPSRIMRTRDAHTSRTPHARGPAYVRGIPLEGNPDFP